MLDKPPVFNDLACIAPYIMIIYLQKKVDNVYVKFIEKDTHCCYNEEKNTDKRYDNIA